MRRRRSRAGAASLLGAAVLAVLTAGCAGADEAATASSADAADAATTGGSTAAEAASEATAAGGDPSPGVAAGVTPAATPAVTTGVTNGVTTGVTTGAAPDDASLDAEPLPPWPVDAPYLAKALIAGSWNADAEGGFDQQPLDEAGLRVAYTNRRAGRRKWVGMRGNGEVLPVDALIRDREGPAFAYVYALVQRAAPEPFAPGAYEPPTPAVLHLRTRGQARVWFDGEHVLDVPAPPPGEVSQVACAVTLTGAFDVVLIKVGRGSTQLGESFDLEARLSLLDGSVVPGQSFNTMRPSHLPPDQPPESLR